MALPSPLTPAQVGGSNDVDELRAEFNVGPSAGYVLLVSKNDPNLATSVRDGSVVVEDPGAFALPAAPVLTSLSPSSVVAESTVVVGVLGTGFVDDMVINRNGGPMSTTFVSSIRLEFTWDDDDVPGAYQIAVEYPDVDPPVVSNELTLTVTA